MWDIAEFMAPVYLGGLIFANILVVNGFLTKMDILPFLFSNRYQAMLCSVLLIILAMLYYRKKQREAILEKYAQESNKARIRGNIIVAVYVGISFLSIFAVAFFKPGKL